MRINLIHMRYQVKLTWAIKVLHILHGYTLSFHNLIHFLYSFNGLFDRQHIVPAHHQTSVKTNKIQSFVTKNLT